MPGAEHRRGFAIRWPIAILVFALILALGHASAHGLRPAYLQITETAQHEYEVNWKAPALLESSIGFDVRLPDECQQIKAPRQVNQGANIVRNWTVMCDGGLLGREIVVAGLAPAAIETIVRIERLDGNAQNLRLAPGEDRFTAAEPSTWVSVASAYVPLGIDHILLGFDHLCFVLALLLLVDNTRKLVWAITAFTVAHSITLSVAALGFVDVPSAPVEALIALSIVLVAAEVVAKARGGDSPAMRKPWMIAFAFGLLHGFGFAGALAETGLPNDAIPLALFFFNVGVEIGQLVFAITVVALLAVLERFSPSVLSPMRTAITFAIGSLAAFWTIQRISGIIVG